MRPRLRPMLGRAWQATSREQQLLLRAAVLDDVEVRRLCELRLRVLLRHAWASSPGWCARLEAAGVVRAGRVDLDRLAGLAPLTREELSTDPDRFTIRDLRGRGAYTNTTGGSTGEPVVVTQDRRYLAWTRAIKTTFDAFTGYVPGEAKLVVWGAASRDTRRHPALSTRLRHLAKHEVWVDASRIDGRELDRWATLADRQRPVQVLGYAESLDVWARHLLARGRALPPPRAVMSTAGVLTDDMRARITAAFRAPVFDRYGTREVSDIACETAAHDGLAVPPLHVQVEIVDDAGEPCVDGQDGEVLVTSLTNGSMPLIRYRLGDRAAWATSAAAPSRVTPGGGHLLPRAWPRLARVTGRITEHFVTREGALVHAGALRTRLYGLQGVRGYQLLQTAPDAVTVRVVLADRGPAEVDAQVHHLLTEPLARLLGGPVHLEVAVVDAIATTPTGKHRHTLCLVDRTADDPRGSNPGP